MQRIDPSIYATDITSALDPLVQSVLPDRRNAVHQLFVEQGCRAPVVIWSPTEADYRNSAMMRFAALCRERMREDGTVPVSAIDPDDMPGLRDWLMLLDLRAEQGDFVYRYYGAGIAEFYGQDMTGRSSTEFHGHIALFFNALYRAATIKREWVLSEHEPPAQIFVRVWRRLIVPLSAADGRIAGFAVLNLPENELRAGLEVVPEPVLVLDRDMRVHYANRPARELFNRHNVRKPEMTLYEYAGLDWVPEQTPEELLTSGAVQQDLCLGVSGILLVHFQVTVKAARHRSHAFYVLSIRTVE